MNAAVRRIAGITAAAWLIAGPCLAGQKIGQPASPFTVVTFDNQKISSEELRGKVMILNLWATWCGPCRNEMLVMDTYVRRHSGSDLKIFAITIDETATTAQLRPLAKALSFPLIRRLSGSGYGTIGGAVPTSYVIDRAGIVRLAQAGAFTAESIDQVITPLLAEPPPAPKLVEASAPGPQRQP